MTVLKALARPVHAAYSAENQDGFFDVTREFSLEMASLESCLREFEQATDLIYSIESLTREFFTKGDNITEYEAHLFQVSIEASFTAAGVNLPAELIVPSFEAAEATADAKEKVDEKKEGLFKRLFKWLGERMRAAADWIKKLFGRFKKADETIEKKVEDLKKKAAAAEEKQNTAYAQIGHDPNAKKGAGDRTHYNDVKEKDAGKHGRSDSYDKQEPADNGSSKSEQKPAEKPKESEGAVRTPSKTVRLEGALGQNISEEVLRTFTGRNGKPVDIHSHMETVLQSADRVDDEFHDLIQKTLDYARPITEGKGATIPNREGNSTLPRNLGITQGKLDFVISPCAKVSIVDETRKSGMKLKVRTEYAYKGTLPNELPRIEPKKANEILGLFDKYQVSTRRTRWGKVVTRLEEAAKMYENMATTYKDAGNKADSNQLKEVGAVVASIATAPAQFEEVRYRSIGGVLNYLNLCLTY